MVAATVRTVNPPKEVSPYLGVLRAAYADGLPCKIVERIAGGRYITTHSYPAATISRFVTAHRRGTVVVLGMTRINVKNIVSVTVETANGAVLGGSPLGSMAAIGPDGRL